MLKKNPLPIDVLGKLMNHAKIEEDGLESTQTVGAGDILRNEVEVNERGQIVIPAKIRNLLGLEKNSRLRITLTKTGLMELQKVIHIPVDYSLEFDGELRGRVHAAYGKMEKGKVADGETLKPLLK